MCPSGPQRPKVRSANSTFRGDCRHEVASGTDSAACRYSCPFPNETGRHGGQIARREKRRCRGGLSPRRRQTPRARIARLGSTVRLVECLGRGSPAISLQSRSPAESIRRGRPRRGAVPDVRREDITGRPPSRSPSEADPCRPGRRRPRIAPAHVAANAVRLQAFAGPKARVNSEKDRRLTY